MQAKGEYMGIWGKSRKRSTPCDPARAAFQHQKALTFAWLLHLIQTSWVQPIEYIVLFNTCSGLKYLETAI